jgi:hypothetical protein
MANHGLRISKTGKNAINPALDDISFDSDHSSLMLLKKKTIAFSALAGQTGQGGTETYAHGLGYAPFTLGFVEYPLYTNTVTDILPHVYDNATPYGSNIYIEIELQTDSTNITITWTVEQTVAGSPEGLDNKIDFNVTLHVYSYELGSKTD